MQTTHDPYFTVTGKTKSRSPSSTLRLMAWSVLQVVVVSAFIGLIAGSVWLFYHGYPRLVAATALIGFMAAAAFAGDSWRERIALSLSVTFFVLGGAAGLFVYFTMFSFPWFEAVFNDKGSGPLGLLLFVCGFAVAGGLSGAWVLERAFGLRKRQGTPPDV